MTHDPVIGALVFWIVVIGGLVIVHHIARGIDR